MRIRATRKYKIRRLEAQPFLEAIILHKFPRWCFYCQQSPCKCAGGPHMQDLADKAANKKRLRAEAHRQYDYLRAQGQLPHSLPSFVKMFQDLFGHKNFDQPDVIITAHFQEEIGEICEVMNRMYDQAKIFGQDPEDLEDLRLDLEDELADAFSWMVALYTKVDYILGGARQYVAPELPSRADPPWLGKTFEQLIWDAYVKQADYMADPSTGMRPIKPVGKPLPTASDDTYSG